MYQVVLMMAESDLVAAEFLREVKHFFASLPGTEETGLFLLSQAGGCLWIILITRIILNTRIIDLEARAFYVEPDTEFFAELLQIAGVCLVMDVLHPNVQRLDLESWVVNLRALRQEFCQQERVLATRESHEDMVIIFDQMISSHRLDEPLFQTLLQATALYL